jgi:vacuolar iron transporter family protein
MKHKGEYVATKTQQEVMDGEIALERKHIAKNRDFELLELKEAFGIIGIPEEDNSEEVVNLRRHLMDYYAKNDEAHVKVHAVLELGVVEEEKRNPFIAGGVAFFLFFFGAMPSVIPFVCTSDIKSAFIAAAVSTTTALLLVGVVKTWATRGNLWLASLENLLIAAGGGGIAYGVGVGFEKLVNGR